MRIDTKSSPDDIDVTSLWSLIRVNAPKLLGVAALVGVATFGGLMLVPSRFTSEAQLRIGGQGGSDPFRDPKVGTSPSPESVAAKVDKEAVASQVVALKSRDLGSRVAKELGLAKLPEFNSAVGPHGGFDAVGRMLRLTGPRSGESEDERVLNAYFRALQVFQVKDTRVITIEFSASDSELAARAANHLAEIYQEWLRSQGVSQTADASDWLKPQIEKLSREVADAEAAVEKFRGQANLYRGGATNAGLNEQQLTDLSTDVTKARAARGEAEARARSARDLLNRGNPDAISDVQKSPVIQGLIAQRAKAEREKAEADTQLLPGHPRMKQLNANVIDLKRAVNKEAVVIVEGLEKEAKVLALREELAAKSLEEAKAKLSTKSGDIAHLAALEGQAKAKRRELETLQASFEAARSRGDVKSVPIEAQLISAARPSSTPTSPKRPQLAALAAATSLILGLVLVVLRGLTSQRGGAAARPAPVDAARSEPDVAVTPAAAVAAARGATRRAPEPAPAPAPAPARVAAQVAAAPMAAAAVAAAPAPQPAPSAATAEALAAQTETSIDDIARRILGNADAQGGYRTVVVGEAPGMDVREEAADLAGALSISGRQVVLVDWSRDGEGFAPALGIDAVPGIIDLVEGRASFEAVIHRLPDSDAHIICCGSVEAGDRLAPDRINLILDALDEAYDHIVVTGDHGAVHDLFLAIEGRFDAGITVADRRRTSAAPEPDTFLGFTVTDIDVIRLETPMDLPTRKLQLAGSDAGDGARA